MLEPFKHEARAIGSLSWKVTLDTLCRVALSTISVAFVGHLGSSELAASALAGIWVNGIQQLIAAFAASLGSLCGQAYGAKNFKLVGIWFQLCMLVLTAFAIPAMVSFFFVDRILGFVTNDSEVLRLANTYARYSVPMVWPQAMYCALRQYLQAQEIITPAMTISVLSVAVSLISNQVLIYGYGQLPALGFIGSPIAQCIASVFQPIALFSYACWFKGYHKPTWFGFQLSECLQLDRVRYFAKVSAGVTISLALDGWVYNGVSMIAGSLGPLSFAANGVILNLLYLIYGVYWGVGIPTLVRCAAFLGGNDPIAARRTLHVGLALGVSATAATSVGVFVFRDSIIACFSEDPEVIFQFKRALPAFCVAIVLAGTHAVISAAIEAMALAATLIGVIICGSWLVTLPTAYTFAVVLNGGIEGLWWGSVCGESVKVVLIGAALWHADWVKMAMRVVKQSEGRVQGPTELACSYQVVDVELGRIPAHSRSEILSDQAKSPNFSSLETPTTLK